ncbi:hypothetical protein LINPERHAP2_LOCUS17053 [Linum perenne]
MLNQDWMIKVEHIKQEGNRAVDFLTRFRHDRSIVVHSILISYPL